MIMKFSSQPFAYILLTYDVAYRPSSQIELHSWQVILACSNNASSLDNILFHPSRIYIILPIILPKTDAMQHSEN